MAFNEVSWIIVGFICRLRDCTKRGVKACPHCKAERRPPFWVCCQVRIGLTACHLFSSCLLSPDRYLFVLVMNSGSLQSALGQTCRTLSWDHQAASESFFAFLSCHAHLSLLASLSSFKFLSVFLYVFLCRFRRPSCLLLLILMPPLSWKCWRCGGTQLLLCSLGQGPEEGRKERWSGSRCACS